MLVTTPQKPTAATTINAVALVTSLKSSPAPSNSELIAEHLFEQLRQHGAVCESIRCVDHSILPGVEADMGAGDEWPAIRDKVLKADILIIATPTWMGHMSSVAQRVLDRLDAELSYTDEADRPHLAGKVALAAVVGNEDGAHKIVADIFQALNDVGYSIPAQGCTYWKERPCNPPTTTTSTRCPTQLPPRPAPPTATLCTWPESYAMPSTCPISETTC